MMATKLLRPARHYLVCARKPEFSRCYRHLRSAVSLSTSQQFSTSATLQHVNLSKPHLVYSDRFNGRAYTTGFREPPRPWTDVSFTQLMSMINSKQIQLIDVRSKKEVNETGMIPGATHMPLSEVAEAFDLTEETFETRYGVEKPYQNDADIVFYCLVGGRSIQAVDILHKAGYFLYVLLEELFAEVDFHHDAYGKVLISATSRCKSVRMTLDASHMLARTSVVAAVYTLARHYPAGFQGYEQLKNAEDYDALKPWTDLNYDELMTKIKSKDIQLFDVRSEKEVENTGMIPGATNIPVRDASIAFELSPSKFKAKYGVEMPSKEDENVVLHCLGGFRSLAALSVLYEAGFQHVRHYPGGWEEYSALSSR